MRTTGALRLTSTLAVVAVVLALLPAPAAMAELPKATEYELKAEFVWRFTLYIEWPEEALPAAGKAFVIGVVGDDALVGVLEETVTGRTIKERPVSVRTIVDPDTIDECRIVFIARAAEPELHRILARTGKRPILTVADSDGYAERGVIINFFLTGEQLRFEVNETAARRAGLQLRSKLLRVAHVVHNEEPLRDAD